MWKIFMIFALALIDSYMMVDYHAKYRPQLHFSVPKGWLNDPNGFVYHNGYYHLFYQHNPNDTKWGPMYWGHVVSKDLVHWSNKEIALKPFQLGAIYSGCAITDKRNVTGLKKKDGLDPMIIIYTIDDSGFEQQGLAYTTDGETFHQYENNPIISNPNIRDFRDPNVFFYNNQYYVMVLAAGDRVQFYNSTNLLNWELLSEFGYNPGQGEKKGVWECPSLFELPVPPVNGEAQKNKWILYVSLNMDNDPNKRGSVTQYFVGQFNGKEFINSNSNNTILWADYGPDNYAGIPLSENPDDKNEVILISWMSNWMYGHFTPTDTWRGQITLPRKAAIERVRDDYYLTQLPIDKIFKQRDYPNLFMMKQPFLFKELSVFKLKENASNLAKFNLFNIEIKFEIDGKFSDGEFGVRLLNDANEFVRLGYNISTNNYYFDRRNSGLSIHENFLRKTEFERISDKVRSYEWTIILDTSAVEFFADSGLNVFSGIFYPTNYYNQIEVYGLNLKADENEKLSTLKISSLTVYPLNSIWK